MVVRLLGHAQSFISFIQVVGYLIESIKQTFEDKARYR